MHHSTPECVKVRYNQNSLVQSSFLTEYLPGYVLVYKSILHLPAVCDSAVPLSHGFTTDTLSDLLGADSSSALLN